MLSSTSVSYVVVRFGVEVIVIPLCAILYKTFCAQKKVHLEDSNVRGGHWGNQERLPERAATS